MAEFNPEMRFGNIPDWTNAPGRLIDMSDLFQGLTRGANRAVEVMAVDQENKVDDKLRDAAEAAAEQGRLESLGVGDVPAALKQDFDRATLYRQALEAGTYDSTKFNTRMIAWAKQMRAQYPGHAKLIDAHIARVTGSTPANDILTTLVKEKDELTKAAIAADKEEFTRLKDMSEVLPPSMVTEYQNTSDPVVKGRITNAFFRLKAVNAETKRYNDELKNATEANATQASTVLAKNVDELSTRFFQGVAGQTGMSLTKLRDTITKFSEGGFSPEETAQLHEMGASAKAWLDSEYARITTSAATKDGRSLSELLANDYAKMENQKKRVDELKGMIDGLISGEKSGFLAVQTAIETARNQSTVDKLFAGSQGEVLRNWKALESIIGKDLMHTFYMENLQKDENDPIKASFKAAIMLQSVGEGQNIGTVTQQYIDQVANDPALAPLFNEGYRGGVEALVKMTQDDEMPLEARNKALTAIIADTEGVMLRHLKDTPDKTGLSSRDKAFKVLTTPAMAEAAEKLGRGAEYRNWVLSQGQLLYGEAIGDINSLNTNSRWFTYRWNPDKLSLDLTFTEGANIPDKPALAAYIRGLRNDIGEKNMQASAEIVIDAKAARESAGMLQKINMINEAMVSALKAENPKIKPEELNQRIIELMGDLNTDPKKGGLVKQILDFVQKDIDWFGTKAQADWKKEQQGENFGVDPGGNLEFRALEQIAGSGSFEGLKTAKEKMPVLLSSLQSDLGINDVQAAGIIGNLAHESAGLQPDIAGDSGAAHGWAQWNGPRKRDMIKWTTENGFDPNSDEGNYAYLIHDLKNNYPKVLEMLKQATNVREATRIIMDHYEKPGIPHKESRVNWANKALS